MPRAWTVRELFVSLVLVTIVAQHMVADLSAVEVEEAEAQANT